MLLHLPDMQCVTYNEENLEDVISRPSSDRTTLTEYFRKNLVVMTRKILYREFLKHYSWIKRTKVWKIRKQMSGHIWRIVYANSAQEERYFLSHPFLRTKIGCIKDSCAPQETVAHIS
jgi:hypothetical protein